MRWLTRRGVLAGGGTLAFGLAGRKLLAADDLPDATLTPVFPRPAPDTIFVQSDGKERRLSEFRGHGMVLNFWATWCVPCVAEMPALAVLSRALAPHDIAVMPLSSDRGGAAVVQRFYEAQKISGLPVLLDPKGEAARAFGVKGIPATVVIDKLGRLCARLDGAADWSAAGVAERVVRLVGRKGGE